MSPENYLQMMREHFASYHNQKEQMVYGAIGLLMAGLTALLSQPQPYWAISSLAKLVSVGAVFFMAGIIFLFMCGQLHARRYAANMVKACDDSILDLLSGTATEPGLLQKKALYIDQWWGRRSPRHMLAILDKHMKEINTDETWIKGLRVLEVISVVIVLLILGIALAIICLTPLSKPCVTP